MLLISNQKSSFTTSTWAEKGIPVFFLLTIKSCIFHAGVVIKLYCLIHDQQKITGSIAVGDNPNDLCITKNGHYLFVANANDNSVSVIDTRQNEGNRNT